MDEQSVRALLERLAETEQPPPRVDIARALKDGRKKLRWRVAAIGVPVAAVVATVAVVAAGAVSFGPHSPGGDGNAPTGKHSATHGPASPDPAPLPGSHNSPDTPGRDTIT